MTNEEALALLPGAKVRAKNGRFTVDAVVKKVYRMDHEYRAREAGSAFLHLRRPGVDRLGRRLATFKRFADEVHHPLSYDGPTANIYADWLEERGERRAADMLREAFPIS